MDQILLLCDRLVPLYRIMAELCRCRPLFAETPSAMLTLNTRGQECNRKDTFNGLSSVIICTVHFIAFII